MGRHKFKKQVIPGWKNIDMNIPGPAKYNVLKTTGSETPKYSMRKLCGETFWVNRFMNNPSPAAYDFQPYVNKNGRFINLLKLNIHDFLVYLIEKKENRRINLYIFP